MCLLLTSFTRLCYDDTGEFKSLIKKIKKRARNPVIIHLRSGVGHAVVCTLCKLIMCFGLFFVFWFWNELHFHFVIVRCEVIRGCASFRSRFMCVFLRENMLLTSLFLTCVTLLLLLSFICRSVSKTL